MKKRISEIEESNEVATLALSRTRMGIRRLRLEYVILLERLEERAIMIPNGANELEEMSAPPSPHLLDDSLNNSVEKSPQKGVKRSRKPPGSGLSAAAKAKIRDPDLPKRPTNAYLIFCEMEKERIKQEAEERDGGVSDLSKSMTEAWKNLDYEKRAPYYRLYEEDRDRYKREMEVYNQKKKAEEEAENTESPNPVKKPRLDSEAPESETPEVEIKSEVNEESLEEPPSREEDASEPKIDNDDDDEEEHEEESTDDRQEAEAETKTPASQLESTEP